jgi:hypothetical protein
MMSSKAAGQRIQPSRRVRLLRYVARPQVVLHGDSLVVPCYFYKQLDGNPGNPGAMWGRVGEKYAGRGRGDMGGLGLSMQKPTAIAVGCCV